MLNNEYNKYDTLDRWLSVAESDLMMNHESILYIFDCIENKIDGHQWDNSLVPSQIVFYNSKEEKRVALKYVCELSITYFASVTIDMITSIECYDTNGFFFIRCW